MLKYKIVRRAKPVEADPLEYHAPYAVVGYVSGVVIREFLRRDDAYEWMQFKIKQGE